MSEPALSLADLTLEHFSPLVGEDFAVIYPDITETLRLERVAAGKDHDDPRWSRPPFSLFFLGATPGLTLRQQIHPLAHRALGRRDLFLVPIGRDEQGRTRYQAAFN